MSKTPITKAVAFVFGGAMLALFIGSLADALILGPPTATNGSSGNAIFFLFAIPTLIFCLWLYERDCNRND